MKKKNNNKWKFIIITLIIIITIICIMFYYYLNNTERIVMNNREQWDIFSSSDSMMSGDYMGKIYEQDYEITNLPPDMVTVLFLDHYLATTSGFYDENNKINDLTYEQVIPKKEFEKQTKKLFGPDYNVNLSPTEYGCGRYLRIDENNYIIGSRDPDACGIFNGNSNYYASYISDYKKEKSNIIINLKVAYIDISSLDGDTTGEFIKYKVYKNKTKKELLDDNYNPNCLYDDNINNTCYEFFINYKIILKRESNFKYYFYSIQKGDV